jgi:predicted site-specific integrase-resolvase
LIRWADSGLIRCLRPGGTGQRKFDLSSLLKESDDDTVDLPQATEKEKIDAVYGRVSTRKQKPYLDTQVTFVP